MEFKTFRRTLLIAAFLFVPAGTSMAANLYAFGGRDIAVPSILPEGNVTSRYTFTPMQLCGKPSCDLIGVSVQQGKCLGPDRWSGPEYQRAGPLGAPAAGWHTGEQPFQGHFFANRGGPVVPQLDAALRRPVRERSLQLVLPHYLQGRAYRVWHLFHQVDRERHHDQCDLPGRRPDREAAVDRCRTAERRRHLRGRYPVQSRSGRLSSRVQPRRLQPSSGGGAVAEGSGVLPRLAGSTATGVSIRVTDEAGVPLRMGLSLPVTAYDKNTGGAYWIPMKASYVQTAEKITPGSVLAAMVILLDYQ